MKALSLTQPFATLVAKGRKTIETRKWGTSYRGRILICSTKGKTMFDRGINLPQVVNACRGLTDFPKGVGLATARIVDVRPMTKTDEEAACCPIYERAKAWELTDICELPQTVYVCGSLGLFDVDVNDPWGDRSK